MLNENDAKSFYTLLARYNKLSPNIAILGDTKRFKEYSQKLIKYCKKNNLRLKINNTRDKITIIFNDEQILNYIQIDTIDKMIGYYFRKYI